MTQDTQTAAPGVSVEASIQIVEKPTCIAVHRGNSILGNFTGPECAKHAQMFADALLASAAGSPVEELQGVTDLEVRQVWEFLTAKNANHVGGVREALEQFLAVRAMPDKYVLSES